MITLQKMRAGDPKPAGTKHWGGLNDGYAHRGDHLPAKTQYTIYDVPAHPDSTTVRGTRRIIVGDDGSMYYTNTHYGDAGGNPFYRIK